MVNCFIGRGRTFQGSAPIFYCLVLSRKNYYWKIFFAIIRASKKFFWNSCHKMPLKFTLHSEPTQKEVSLMPITADWLFQNHTAQQVTIQLLARALRPPTDWRRRLCGIRKRKRRCRQGYEAAMPAAACERIFSAICASLRTCLRKYVRCGKIKLES